MVKNHNKKDIKGNKNIKTLDVFDFKQSSLNKSSKGVKKIIPFKKNPPTPYK
jgi:hypothetical protein